MLNFRFNASGILKKNLINCSTDISFTVHFETVYKKVVKIRVLKINESEWILWSFTVFLKTY